MTDIEQAEHDALVEKAKLLGVKHHPSISTEKLAEKIKEFQADAEAKAAALAAAGTAENTNTAAGPAPGTAAPTPAAPAKTAAQLAHDKIVGIRADAEKLVRIRVTCMNPAKKDWPGEIISVGNRAVGTLKKFVPFNADEGWHVPKMIFDVMKARECQVFVTSKAKNGVSVRTGKLIKEFAIEVLDQLTQAELDELARRQAMAAGGTE